MLCSSGPPFCLLLRVDTVLFFLAVTAVRIAPMVTWSVQGIERRSFSWGCFTGQWAGLTLWMGLLGLSHCFSVCFSPFLGCFAPCLLHSPHWTWWHEHWGQAAPFRLPPLSSPGEISGCTIAGRMGELRAASVIVIGAVIVVSGTARPLLDTGFGPCGPAQSLWTRELGSTPNPSSPPVGSSSPVTALHMATPWCSHCSVVFLQAEVLTASLGCMDWDSQGLPEAGANAKVQKSKLSLLATMGYIQKKKQKRPVDGQLGGQSKVEGQEKKHISTSEYYINICTFPK